MTEKKTIVHSYFTSGFLEMAKIFVKSFIKHNDIDQYDLILDSRDLKEDQVIELYGICDKMIVNNKKINMKAWAKKAEVSLSTFQQYRREVESKFVTQKNRVWKLMVAGEDRIRALEEVIKINYCPDREDDVIAHFDIDTYFKGDILSLVERGSDFDALMKFRLGHEVVKARITIDCMTFKPKFETLQFVQMWLKILDENPPKTRPIGFGQTSCWMAYELFKDVLEWGDVPIEYGLPGRSKPGDKVWTGNIHQLPKDEFVKMAERDLNE